MAEESVSRPPWGRVPFDRENRSRWSRVPFPYEEYQARWNRLAVRLREAGLDALVVYGTTGEAAAIRYLTNFDSALGHSIAIVTAKGECVLLTNGLFRSEPMHSQIWLSPVPDVRPAAHERLRSALPPLSEAALQALSDYSADRRIGLAGAPPYAVHHKFRQRFGDAGLVDFTPVLNDVMSVKSECEIALIRRALSVSDRAYERVRSMMRPGLSELDYAGAVFEEIGRGGAEGLSFPLSLVGGPRSGHKQVGPIDYRLEDGDFLFMDLGIFFEGYATDNSRGGVVGRMPEDKRLFLQAGEDMTMACIAAAGPGVPQQRLDDAAFAVARDYGFVDDYYFRAHGIGTAPFMAPRFMPNDETPMRPGEVFVVEPMLIREGFGTACDEFTVLITENGTEVLSTAGERWWDRR
ncbi:MAG: Xaa-Pro peptidase family protein [Rhizobiaceae bacterium]